MYKLEIIQGNNIISCTDVDLEVLTQFVNEYIGLFGPETQFVISSIKTDK